MSANEEIQFEEECSSEESVDEVDNQEEVDVGQMLNYFFTNKNGDVLADVVTGLKEAQEKQNAILMKIGALLQQKFKD